MRLRTPPTRYVPHRLTLARLARKVKRRMVARSVFVHNALIREILYQAFDAMTEHMMVTRVEFLNRWAEHEYFRPHEKQRRICQNLRRRYGRKRYFAEDQPDVLPTPIRDVPMFTPDEMLAMYELHEQCESRGDIAGVKAVDKALIYLRPQAPSSRR